MIKEYVKIESPFTGGRVFEVSDVEEKKFRGEKFIVNVQVVTVAVEDLL